MRWGRIESQLLLRGEACGCCCGDISTADDDDSTADALQTMMTAPQMAYEQCDGSAAMAMQAIKAAGCEDSRGCWCCVGGPSSSAALEQAAWSSSHVAM